MAQSLTELLGSGAEKLGGWGLETGAKAKKKLSEIADIATANDTSTAGDKVTAIGQSLAQGGGALLGDVGKAIDTVNPINYAPKLFGAKTLSEQGYGTEKLLSNIGKVPGNVITAIGEGGSALSDAIDKTQRVFGGEISAADYGVGLTKDLTKLGASGIQSVFSMAAPLIQPVIGTAFEMTGADKLTASGREIASKGIMDAFGVPEKYREDVKSSLYSSFDIASAAAGIKGSKTMQGLQQAKNSKGINMYLQDGSPMMVPAKGAAKTYNVAKGMLQASLPDMTLAITGAIGLDDSVGTKVGKAIATSLLTVAANHPAIGPDMFKAKGKLTDSELQAKNEEDIKADTEAVSKSEKSLSQIALDKADKRNSESKTIGKWTPELEAEYKKSGFSGSRGDYMKLDGKTEPVTIKQEPIEDTIRYSDIASYTEMGGTPLPGKTNAWKQSRYDTLMKSLSKEEQTKPIVIDKDGKGGYSITDGNHRFEVLKELGRPIKYIEWVTKKEGTIYPDNVTDTIKEELVPAPEPTPTVVPAENASKEAKPTLSELATTPEPTITPEPTKTEALPFETNATKADLTNNLVNDAVKNEESRNQTSGKFEVATLPGRIGALISEKGGRLLSLGAYLNKIKVVLENGKRVPFNTYIDSVRSSAINIANGILDRYNVRKTVTALPDPGDIKIGNDALEGAVTPMGTVITKDNSYIVKDVLKDIARLRFDHLGFDNKKLAKINALGYVWRINQGRPDIIDKYVPKEYQDFFQSINDETGLTRKIYDDAGNVLTDKKALYEYDPNDMYTRFILSETGKEFMRKNGVKYQLNVDGKDIEYDSVEDLRKAMGMYQAQGKAVTDKTVKNFESILKEKGGASIDIFRIHSPLAQLLDYSGHFGKLVSDIEVVKKFGELQKEKDPSVQAYVDKMTTSENFANPLEQVLNINRAAKGLGEKVSQSLGNLARAQLLYGSVKNLVQGMTSAQLRRAMYASGAVKGQAGKFTDYKNADNELVQSRLHGEGFMTNYELLPGQSSALKDQIIWWSSAGENSAKTHIALSGMEQALKDNNVPYAKDDALSITEKFQEWASIPENRDRAIEIKSDIKQNNNTVSDVSSMARSQVPFMQRFGFGSMKTYGIGQVTQNLQDIGAITERAIRGKGKISNEQTAKAASRLGVQLGGYALIAATISQLWKASQPETDNEDELDRQAEAIGNAVAGQAYGNPAASFKNLFTGILSNTGLAPIQAAADIAQVISLFASRDPQGYKAGMNELIRSTVKNSAIGKTFDATAGILSGESLQKMFADALGSVSRENQTRSGVSTGKKTDSRAEFAGNLLGYNTDNAIEQMIYTNFEKSKIAQEYGLKADGIPVGILSTLTRIYTDNARSLGQPGKIFEGVTKYNDNVILQQYVANVVNASRDIKTFSDLLASVPGAGKGLDKAREDVKSANDSYEKLLDETWVTFGIDNSLPVAQKLEILRTNNPVAYNNTVAGIAKSLMYMNKVKDGTAKYSKDEAMKNMYKSDANVDAAISELNGTAPNSVAVIDQINSGLTQFTSDIGEIGLDEAKKKFAYVEAMNKMMNGVSLYSDTYEKALANGTFQYDQVVKTMEDNGYKDFKKDYPITAELIRRGLELRGETQLKPTAGQFPTENGMIGTSGSNQPSSGTPIKSNIQTIGTPKKPKLSELALLKPVQVAPKPLFNPLAQPTEGSLLQMAMRKK